MLTELDNCILGVVWREGPMSAYDVRNRFAQSTTVAWSSSTGTVYPAIKRLVKAGLLNASARSGPRNRQSLALTSPGMKALCQWLDNVAPELGSPTADPLRTRVQFLAALGRDKRKRALDQYRAVTGARMKLLEELAQRPAESLFDRLDRLGILGALREVRARLDWLDEIEPELARLEPGSGR
jgi:DNA-binding PadR family transcriptional regulator